jgi:hypothetical protein
VSRNKVLKQFVEEERMPSSTTNWNKGDGCPVLNYVEIYECIMMLGSIYTISQYNINNAEL